MFDLSHLQAGGDITMSVREGTTAAADEEVKIKFLLAFC